MPESQSAPDARQIIVLGDIDPTAADAADDADAATLRQLIGLEVARIARSMGHNVTVVADEEPPAGVLGEEDGGEYPWMHGVTWETTAGSSAEASSFDGQELAVISLAGWRPSLGTVRGDIDDPQVQSMTDVAGALADAGVGRIVFVDIDDGPGTADPVAELRRNTRDQIGVLLREQSAFGAGETELSFVVGAGPVWTQRDRLMAADDESLDALIEEGEAKTDDAEDGDRVEAVAIAAIRTALDDEYRPEVSGDEIVDLGHAMFAQ
jgi:hypothetical protein